MMNNITTTTNTNILLIGQKKLMVKNMGHSLLKMVFQYGMMHMERNCSDSYATHMVDLAILPYCDHTTMQLDGNGII